MNIHEDKLVYIGKLKEKIKNLEVEKNTYKEEIDKLEKLSLELGFDDLEEMKGKIKSTFKN